MFKVGRKMTFSLDGEYFSIYIKYAYIDFQIYSSPKLITFKLIYY